jgi:hypothetical protein
MSENVIEKALRNAKVFDPDAPLFDKDGGLVQEQPIYCTHKPKLVAMSDWGTQLPHGFVRDGRVERTFTLRKPTAKLELEVGALAAQPAFAHHHGRRMTAIAALVLEELAGEQMGRATERALATIGALVPSDVIYILACRALQRSQQRVPLTYDPAAPCPHCRNPIGPLEAKASDIRVQVFPDWTADAPVTAAVAFAEPVLLAGESVSALAVQPTRWGQHIGSVRTPEEMTNGALLAQMGIESSIVGYRTAAGAACQGGMPRRDLENLLLWDWRAVSVATTTTWGGLWAIAMVRHTCGELVPLPFDSGMLLAQ